LFQKNKSSGYKKLRTQADGYAGLSNREILKVTNNDIQYKRFTARFTNKAALKPISDYSFKYHIIYFLQVSQIIFAFNIFA